MLMERKKMNKYDERFMEAMNKAVESCPELQRLFTSSPAYTYWTDKKGNQWFYTKEKIMHKGRMRYVAGKYRFLKTKKMYKLVKKVGFAKKKDAIKWAYEHCFPGEKY